MKPTLKKARLLELLAGLPDDANIYVSTRTESALDAAQTAARGSGDELFFRLSGDVIREVDGVSLVVDFGWSK